MVSTIYLFCLLLLVVVNSVFLLFNFPISVLELVNEMADMQTTEPLGSCS